MKYKKILLAVGVMAMLFSVNGCKKEEAPKKEDTAKESVEQQAEPEKKEEEESQVVQGAEVVQEGVPANQNLLTGIGDLSEVAIGKRPVAVMVNNVQKAMPQYGVSQADLIFEIPVEGDATRFMALYGDYTKVPQVCPIRSCRYYFPALSQGFDAFYVNWGIDDTIADYLEALDLDQIEGITNTGGLFGRDQEKLSQGYAVEHTGFFDGTKLASYIESKGLRTDLREEKKGAAFLFNGMEEQLKPEGSDCTQVDVQFGAQSSTFTYDAEKKVYLKQINGTPQIDAKTGEQLAFTNVLVLETEISVRDEVGRKKIDWDGGANAKGYYISNGGVQEIHWSKDENNEESYLRFYDLSGNEIKINRGKSYIALNYANKTTMK